MVSIIGALTQWNSAKWFLEETDILSIERELLVFQFIRIVLQNEVRRVCDLPVYILMSVRSPNIQSEGEPGIHVKTQGLEVLIQVLNGCTLAYSVQIVVWCIACALQAGMRVRESDPF